MTKRTTIPGLIVASPGPLRSALHSLLISLPEIDSIVTADHPDQAVLFIIKKKPLFILVVLEHGRDWKNILPTIRREAPDSLLVILTDQVEKIVAVDLILQQGLHPKDLIAAVEQLVRENGNRY